MTTATIRTTVQTTVAAAQKTQKIVLVGWVRDPNFSWGSGGETGVPYTNRDPTLCDISLYIFCVQLVTISEDSKDMMKASSKLGAYIYIYNAYTIHVTRVPRRLSSPMQYSVWNMSCTTWVYSTAVATLTVIILLVLLILLLSSKSL